MATTGATTPGQAAVRVEVACGTPLGDEGASGFLPVEGSSHPALKARPSRAEVTTMPPVSHIRRARAAASAAALVACLAAGCGPSAAPTEVAAAPTEAVSSAPIGPAGTTAGGAVAVARRAASTGEGMPDVTGGGLDAARTALSAVGARGAALVFADDAVVTAQFPAPGQAVPAEADVVLWVGAPAGVTVEVVDEVAPLAATGTGADLDPSAPAVEPGATAPSDATGDVGAAGAPQPDGLASWYGPGFEGDLTPCGERVDPDAVTFAGPDLPCGTRVRVTGPDGAVVEAVLTDRGPAAWTGRRYNLSRAAFDEIADLATGVVPIRVEALD